MKKKMRDASAWWNRIPVSVKTAFVCCFICGFIFHIFAFTNIIPNSDGISRVADAQQMTVSGRWFLHYASVWNGYVQMPAVIGFFSVLFMSVSAALVCDIFKIRNVSAAALCGALMIVFPSVAFTYLYMFTASAYFFGLALAVFAVWLSTRYKFGFLFAAVPLACAIGTYQAYVAAAAALALIFVILQSIDGERSAKDVIIAALKQLAFLALGLVIYYAVLRIFLAVKDLELLSYKGIASFGNGFSIKALLSAVVGTYKDFVSYFFLPERASTYTTVGGVVFNALAFALGIAAFVKICVKKRLTKRIGAFVITLILCVLIPLAMNLTYLMDPAVMPVMRYALVFAYIFVIALCERASDADETKKVEVKKRLTLRGAAVIVSVAVIAISFNIDNLAYTVSAQAHRATQSFAARLVERVESMEGYKNGMEVVVIGTFPTDIYNNDIDAYRLVEDYSNQSTSVLLLNKHVYYYLNDWINVPWREPDEQTMIDVASSEDFKAMPRYPDDGSVRIDGERVIVKLAEEYTPKQDFEIAYENRR